MRAFLFLLLLPTLGLAQDPTDPTYNEYRSWWDLTFYDLEVEVDFENQSLSGKNTIYFQPVGSSFKNFLQIDLQAPMKIKQVLCGDKEIEFSSAGSVHLIATKNVDLEKGITVLFSGKPKKANYAPWESGLVWTKDGAGNPWVASACQEDGASIWWPCKDHPKDEPDSMRMTFVCPSNLTAVGNGRLQKVENRGDSKKAFTWVVKNPINAYGVNLSIGNYTYFKETIKGLSGDLDATYYVLPENIEKAKKQFLDAPRTIEALEYWFGPYPFYEDGYKLVEVPYLGMEHQSCVTYGNKYKNGYLGNDLSGSGWGLKFDFIIIHESGHEWFANSITHSNTADLWIHEGFTSYSEALFLEYFFGEEAASEYIIGTRKKIMNDKPIIGDYTLGVSGSSDMYFKGANMLHTLRQMLADSAQWRKILLDLNKRFYKSTVSSAQIENFLALETGLDLEAFFNQYLRDTRIPLLEYQIKDKRVVLQFKNVEKSFHMPLRLKINGEWINKDVGSRKARIKLSSKITELEENPNYYIRYRRL
ncbi:MAG: M1 family metallopeptidase [Luteibaculum sp.]